MAELEIRPLRRDDDRSRFTCGEPAIDRYFQHYAGQNQFKLHLTVHWVVVRDHEVLGFAAVSAGSLDRHSHPDSTARRRLPQYPLPVLRLARLGVEQRAQGAGLGRALVRHVLRRALAQRDLVGCVGVVTDAKPAAVAFYEGLGFQHLDGVREGAVHGGAEPLFLDLRTIAAAQ